MDRALRLLAVRSYSRMELQGRLSRHADPSEVSRVIAELEEKGYLDDSRFGYDRATGKRSGKHWGRARIARDLMTRGIDANIIGPVLDRVTAELPETESLQAAVNAQVARRGEPSDFRQLKRLFDYCVRLGYSESLVREALSPFFARLERDRE